MVNLVDRMSRECFDEIAPIFAKVQAGELDSDEARERMRAIMERRGVVCADSLALFIASVARDIRHKPVVNGDSRRT